MRGAAATNGLLLLLLLPACGSDGCWVDGPPESAALPAWREVPVDATVQDGVHGAVDVHGGYHVVPQPARDVALDDGTYALPARREGDRVELRVQGRWVALEGPIGCD